VNTVSVSITAPDVDWLTEHARSLIDDRLAASGNVIPSVRSVYRWQEVIEDASEGYLILQTQRQHVPEIIRRTNETHPYDTVRVLAVENVEADPDYEQWITDMTSQPESRSRLRHFVIDCSDLDRAATFWAAALHAEHEPVDPASTHVYRKLRVPNTEVRVLLQRTEDTTTDKASMHLDIEADDVEAEVQRLEALGATRYDHQQRRGYDFWVLHDPDGNVFCVLEQRPTQSTKSG
jgi:uncharacterized protein involved in tolerance to divalent cations/catechol 2,3-dioxygenase-like lactoylglutathione lyase family enzyme